MLQMLLYSISIMYTPGPVTITAANIGLNQKFKKGFPFYIGISVAIFLHYIIFGYFGSFFLDSVDLWPVSLIGGLYMLYLAYKLFISNVNFSKTADATVGFKEGFIMQFLNPKAIIAVVPVITIYFPRLNISGTQIFYMAIFFMFLVFGSPIIYALLGQFFSHIFNNPILVKGFNKLMALLLGFISLSILYHDIFMKFFLVHH